MRSLYVEDQRDRKVPLVDNAHDTLPKAEADKLPTYNWEQLGIRDENRRKLVRSLLDQGKVQTAEDFYDAAFIFQHGQQPSDYLLAHVLATEAIALGDRSALWISAATLDRYLQSSGQKQIFGTQYSDEKYAFYLQHRNDKNLVDELKAFTGSKQTMQPYDDTLLPATTRHDFCVPDAAAQRAYLEAVNADKKPEFPRVAACQD